MAEQHFIESAQRTIDMELNAVGELNQRIGKDFIVACEVIVILQGTSCCHRYG